MVVMSLIKIDEQIVKGSFKKKVWGTVALVLVDIRLKLLNQLFKVFLIYF